MKRAAAIVLFVLVAAAAAAPIRSYDYFWHLATGRWIVEHRAIPAVDPLAVASAKTPWINGEWLYEVALYLAPSHALLNALLVAAIFTIAYLFAARENEWVVALLAAAIAFAGASDRLGVRPSTAAALFVVLAIGILSSKMRRTEILYAVLTILWINVHPSALLAPAIALFFGRWIVAALSALALLVNPHGWHAVRAPFELTSFAGSGAFVNAEWLPSDPRLFPLLYLTGLALVAALVVTRERRVWRWAIFLMLFVLAIRHVRYQNFYFAALPLLVPRVAAGFSRLKPAATLAAALIPIAWAFLQTDHGLGVDDSRFPVRAVAKMKGLPGNIYNVDQFGGFLEWTFYPERRVLTDGRNELFREFIAEDARARQDSRAWSAMIAKYDVALAVDEYSPRKIEVVDAVTGTRRSLPSSLVRYRRRDWALIAFDDAAMVFARRAAFAPEQLAPLEYRWVVPDDPSARYPKEARDEIARARRELGDIRVVRELEAGAN
jgi:hypothetical protein